MPPEKWEIIWTRLDRTYRVFGLRTDHARSPRTGKSHDFFIMESSSWVNIIPLTPENKVVLVRQYRHGIRENTLEIPGGMVEDGDTPEEAAIRELMEETGYRAEGLRLLGWVHPNPAIQNNRCYTYLASGAVPASGQNQDEREDIEIVLCPLAQIPELIMGGSITHALVIAAFHRFFSEYLWKDRNP